VAIPKDRGLTDLGSKSVQTTGTEQTAIPLVPMHSSQEN